MPERRAAAAGAECRAASCASGVETLAASCDGAGASCPAEETRECAPYACESDACAESCASASDCASGLTCEAGACVAEGGADAGAPDAAVDDAGVPDSGQGDAGAPVVVDGGCGCRAATSGSRVPWLLALVLALAAIRRRGRSRGRRGLTGIVRLR
ncbi:MAG: MYXO-CTERM sorting domain-containing protein [Sandaracinaceae bacterium]|nr:MYXO-CTERM sorting domain-containing protein [Sandaracinaceae bacterium]